MAENLFPEDAPEITPAELISLENRPVGYMEGVHFDETIGDYARDGQNRLISATRLESWEQWCINCIMTEREAYPAYGGLFGVRTIEAFKAHSREEAESILTLEITEGLMNDPYGRTEAVEVIDYNWSGPDVLEIKVTVKGTDDVSIDLTAVLDQRAR